LTHLDCGSLSGARVSEEKNKKEDTVEIRVEVSKDIENVVLRCDKPFTSSPEDLVLSISSDDATSLYDGSKRDLVATIEDASRYAKGTYVCLDVSNHSIEVLGDRLVDGVLFIELGALVSDSWSGSSAVSLR
jgi:hypothetical protein